MTQDIVERPATLPAPAYNPAAEITAEDVSLPRIKPGDPGNKRVKNGDVPVDSVFTELNTDDVDPQVIAKAKGGYSDWVRLFVLAGPRVNYSWKDDQDNFYTREPGDPELEQQLAAHGSRGKDKRIPRRGFNYIVALPDVDTTLPYKLLLKGASSNAAKVLNMQLLKAASQGPADEVLFEARVKHVERGEYVYCTWEVRRSDVPDSDLAELVANVSELKALAQAVGQSEQVFQEADAASPVTDAPDIG